MIIVDFDCGGYNQIGDLLPNLAVSASHSHCHVHSHFCRFPAFPLTPRKLLWLVHMLRGSRSIAHMSVIPDHLLKIIPQGM